MDDEPAPNAAPTLAARAVTRVAGPLTAGFLRLPDRVLGPLAGRRPEIDGQRVSPALGTLCRASTPFTNVALENPRKLSRAAIDLFAGSMAYGAPTDVPARDFALPDPALGARLYSPPEIAEPAPLLVFFHGGGFVFGSAAGHEGTCLFLAREAGVKILSVNYPLAPENACPAAHEAASAAWAWAVENADRLGADPARISVGGDSAGGNLAAHVALTAEPRPRAAFLLYPVTDLAADDPSRRDFGEGLLLTSKGMSAIARHYGNGGDGEPHAVVSAPVPPDTPPFFVGVAGMDPLRDQGVRLARHLSSAGIDVELARYDGVVHGYATLLVVRECREATRSAASALRTLMQA